MGVLSRRQFVARVELYNHQTDDAENTDLANLPEHKALRAELAGMLARGWQGGPPADVASTVVPGAT